MKLIEGMKKLKILEKKIQGNTERISEYAALPSNRKPHFGTSEAQRKEIQSLLQSNIDMGQEYLKLKRQIDYTNIMIKTQINKSQMSISNMLQIERKIGNLMSLSYAALSDRKAEIEIAQGRMKGDSSVNVERYYNETEKYAGMQVFQGIQDEISLKLETINATTDILEVPDL
jgi:hypothetical protein